MAIPKYTLDYDKQKDDWKLSKQGTGEVVKRFDTKQEATKGGVLEKAPIRGVREAESKSTLFGPNVLPDAFWRDGVCVRCS
jgi:hypothetical protein